MEGLAARTSTAESAQQRGQGHKDRPFYRVFTTFSNKMLKTARFFAILLYK
jgi:hypothetical protein